MSAAAWRVSPCAALNGAVLVPGDKSVSHRVMLLGAIGSAPLEAEGFLRSEDCLATRRAVEMLGAVVEDLPGGGIRVTPPPSSRRPAGPLDFGNSGTGFACCRACWPGATCPLSLAGMNRCSADPMERVAAPLRAMGARIETSDGCPPVRVSPAGDLAGIEFSQPVASAQVKSAVLLAGLGAQGRTGVIQPAVRGTIPSVCSRRWVVRWIRATGARSSMARPDCGRCRVRVPADLSSAAFFIVAALIAGSGPVDLPDVGVNPTRTGRADDT